MRPSQPILDQTDPIFVVPSCSLLTWAVWAWLFVLLGHKQRLPYGVHADYMPHSWPGEGPLPFFGFGAVREWHSVLSTELTEVTILLFCCSKWWTWHLVGGNIKSVSSVLFRCFHAFWRRAQAFTCLCVESRRDPPGNNWWKTAERNFLFLFWGRSVA